MINGKKTMLWGVAIFSIDHNFPCLGHYDTSIHIYIYTYIYIHNIYIYYMYIYICIHRTAPYCSHIFRPPSQKGCQSSATIWWCPRIASPLAAKAAAWPWDLRSHGQFCGDLGKSWENHRQILLEPWRFAGR